LSSRIVFGLILPTKADALAPRMDKLARWLGERAGLEIVRRDSTSYEALANDVRDGRVDMAWLPPIVFVRLGEAVAPLGSIQRGGKSTYEASLIVQKDSRIKSLEQLRGSRAGWVDPWSAAGFVMPRVKLALLNVDPRALFRTEKFYGSHKSAIQALIEGACDVVGTHARADETGNVVSGAWSEMPGADVRVLATFGAIPPDAIATRHHVPEETRAKLTSALRDACADPKMHGLLDEIFGGHELAEGLAPGYDALRSALDMATRRGLFD
jgi:phosphate/phosphite/phosphonate ABC transporter binding protein